MAAIGLRRVFLLIFGKALDDLMPSWCWLNLKNFDWCIVRKGGGAAPTFDSKSGHSGDLKRIQE